MYRVFRTTLLIMIITLIMTKTIKIKFTRFVRSCKQVLVRKKITHCLNVEKKKKQINVVKTNRVYHSLGGNTRQVRNYNIVSNKRLIRDLREKRVQTYVVVVVVVTTTPQSRSSVYVFGTKQKRRCIHIFRVSL